MVADMAGGDWPAIARQSAIAMVAAAKDREPSINVRLLNDVRQIFADSESMTTEDLLTQLVRQEDSTWRDMYGKPLDARGLSKRLGHYTTAEGSRIRPATVRDGSRTAKGYRRCDLEDAWARYLPPIPPKSVTSVTSVTNGAAEPESVTDSPANVTDVTAHVTDAQTLFERDVTDVTDVTDFQGMREAVPVTPLRTWNLAPVNPDWLMFPDSTQCRACGNDLLTEASKTSRCKMWHLKAQGLAA